MVIGTGLALAATSEARTCRTGKKKIAETWNDDRRATIGEAYRAVDLPYAAQTWTRVQPALDAFAQQWSDAYYDACAATRVDGQQSGERLDARMDCLKVQQAHFDSLLAEFEAPDDALVERTTGAVTGLPTPTDCGEVGTLDPNPLPPELRALALEARSAAAESDARYDAGRFGAARESAERGLGLLEGKTLPRVRAHVAQRHAAALHRLGDRQGAEAVLREALRDAAVAADHKRLATLWLDLLYVVGIEGKREQEGIALADAAEVAVLAAGDLPHQRWAYEDKRALLLRGMRSFEEAEAHHRRALEIAAQGAEGPRTFAVLHGNYGNTLKDAGRYEVAKVQLELGLQYDLEAYGEDHPTTAMDLNNIAITYERLADYDRTLELHTRALEIRGRTLGKTHPDYADSVYNLATFHAARQRHDEAEAGVRHAIELWSAAFGEISERVAIGHSQLGNIARNRGDAAASDRHQAKAIEIMQELLGPNHVRVASFMGNRANALIDLGRFEEALALHTEAMRLREAALEPDHPDLAYSLLGQAEAMVRLGRAAEAIPLVERCVQIREAKVKRPYILATAYHMAAETYWEDGSDKARALELGELAYRAYSRADTGDPTRASEMAKWLADRGAPLPVLRD